MSRWDWGSLFLSHLALRNVNKSSRVANRCVKKCNGFLWRMDKRERELRFLQKKVNSVGAVLLEDLEDSENTVKSLKESLEAVHSELQIASDITIPGLVQSNKLLLERTSADTAEQVRRQATNTTPRVEE